MKARTWAVHFAERESFTVTCIPEATQAEILARYPQAAAAEPQGEVLVAPSELLTVAEQVSIQKWPHSLGEADPRTVAGVISRCQAEEGHRRYFLSKASEVFQEHALTAPNNSHADRTSVQHAPQPAPIRHPAATVEKSYTEPTPRRPENG